jgi:putative SOS response-associated peptidase YedK
MKTRIATGFAGFSFSADGVAEQAQRRSDLSVCTRYVTPEQAEIERFWELGRRNLPRWWDPAVFPRAPGPFVRASGGGRELVVGQWGLIPWFATSAKLAYSTNNARFEGIEGKASFKQSWAQGRRCILPAISFDEPCWETGKNVWWRFCRADGLPWGLAGLWSTWTDKETGEIVESYTMLTINADDHPLMSRMHKPDPKLPADRQDKRSVVAIELDDVDRWLNGAPEDAALLVRAPVAELMVATPTASPKSQSRS